MKKHIKCHIKSTLALLLVLASLANIIPVNTSYGAKRLEFSSAIGTNKALNVPLLEENFTVDNWNKWDMQTFATFMSNFCIPFFDSYQSAFTKGSGGSDGAGLYALQFAAGGDVDATGALNTMVNYILKQTEISATTYPQPIYVKYRAFDGNEVNQDYTGKTDTKPATLKDLLVTLVKTPTEDGSSTMTDNFATWDKIEQKGLLGYGWVRNTIKGDGYTNNFYTKLKANYNDSNTKWSNLKYDLALVEKANLPVFFLGENSWSDDGKLAENKTVWDMSDSWDAQMFAAILNYVDRYSEGILEYEANDHNDATTGAIVGGAVGGAAAVGIAVGVLSGPIGWVALAVAGITAAGVGIGYAIGNAQDENDYMASLVQNAESIPLYFDAFGNIVTTNADKTQSVIIIPACMNKNLTSDGRINLLVAPLINNYVDATADALAIGISGTNEVFTTEGERSDNHGASSITSLDGTDASDKILEYSFKNQKQGILVYSSTDSYVANEFYKTKFWKSGDRADKKLTYNDVGYMDKLKEFIFNQHTMGVLDTNLRIEVVGGGDINNNDDGNLTGAVDIIKTFKNLDSSTVLASNYLASQSIAYMNLTESSDKVVLDWCYNEKEKSSILGNVAYASPGIGLSANNGAASQGYLKYFNHIFFKTIVNQIDWNEVNTFETEKTPVIKGSSIAETFKGIATPEVLATFMANGVVGNSNTHIEATSLGSFNATVMAFSGLFKLRENTREQYNKLKGASYENDWNNSVLGDKGVADYVEGFGLFGKSQLSAKSLLQSLRSVAKVYDGGSALKKAQNYLGLVEGTNFAATASWVYLTYLEFYGIVGNKSNTQSYFNEKLLSGMGADRITNPLEVFGEVAMTTEQKKSEVLKYSYLMLHPGNEGRAYRSEVLQSGMSDWLYNQYQKICYGTTDSEKYQSLMSSGTEGFLHIVGYEDNFMTSWIMDNYAKVVMWGMVLMLVIILIFGLMKGMKSGWYVISIISIVIMFIMAPSAGEITPYLCDKMVNKMFSTSMDYWAISETIENLSIDSQLRDDDVGNEVATWISSLQTSQMSKTILLKKDISRKIIEDTVVDFSELQSIQSARWLLPTFMKQIRMDKDNYDYVYTTLADFYQFCGDNYLYYVSGHSNKTLGQHNIKVSVDSALAENTGLSTEFGTNGTIENLIDKYKKGDAKGYMLTDTLIDVSGSKNKNLVANQYRLPYNYTRYTTMDNGPYGKGINKVHFVNYVLAYRGNSGNFKKVVPAISDTDSNWKSGYTLGKDNSLFERYAENVVNTPETDAIVTTFKNVTDTALKDIDGYNHNDVESKKGDYAQSFGYLQTTENLGTYFYTLIKDMFNEQQQEKTLASVIASLQGGKNIYDGKEVRASFMHMNGKTIDVLDLNEVFTNIVPYMYQMQIAALGTDNSDGLLKDEKFGDSYSIYSKSDKAWLYRCNWVTKLLEAKENQEVITVKGYKSYVIENGVFKPGYRNSSGAYVEDLTKVDYVVNAQILAMNYPGWDKTINIDFDSDYVEGYRPMVMSEAEMVMLGLTEKDLSLAELNCIEANREAVRQWTLLLNFSNADSISSEALYRHMAIEALLVFNKTFAPDNFVSSAMALYPYSLDLRNISFDSVMKLIIMSDANNSAYMTQNAMYTVLDDAGTFSGFLFLSTAWLANSAVPFIRNIALGLIFYATVISALWNCMKSTRQKGMMAGGALMCNVLMCVMTVLYYGVYYVFITTSSAEEVLSINKISAGTGVPEWKFFAIFVASLLYMAGLIYFTGKIVVNIKDMGFGMFKQFGIAVLNGLNGLASRAGDSIKNLFSDNSDNSVSSSSISASNSATEISNSEENPISVKTVGDSTVTINNNNLNGELGQETGDSGYMMDGGIGGVNTVTEYQINDIIDKGRGMSETSSDSAYGDDNSEKDSGKK